MHIVTTVRAFIPLKGKILVVQNDARPDYFVLPGGRIEPGERIADAMRRELIEETGVKPELGGLLAVHEFASVKKDVHRIEFFFGVRNGEDYKKIDLNRASHGYEILESRFIDPDDATITILPEIARNIAREILVIGIDQFPIRIVTSSAN